MNSREQELLQKLENNKERRIQNASNESKLRAIEEEDAAYNAELEQIQQAKSEQEAAQQVRIQAQEEKIENEPVPFQLAGVDLSALPVEFIAVMEQITKIDRRNMAEDHNKEIQKMIDANREDGRAWAERELQLKRQNNELQHENIAQSLYISDLTDNLAAEKQNHDEVLRLLNETKLQLNDALSKRDAAMNELDGVKLALEVAQEEIQMRAADHNGEANAQKIIDITPEETSEIQDLVNNLAKKLVTVNAIGGNWKEVVYDDGSKLVVHADEVEQLKAVASPALEAVTFPAYGESTIQLEQANPITIPETVTDEQFRESLGESQENAEMVQEDTGGNRVSEGATIVRSAEVTRDEFEALKADVEVLKCRNGMVA